MRNIKRNLWNTYCKNYKYKELTTDKYLIIPNLKSICNNILNSFGEIMVLIFKIFTIIFNAIMQILNVLYSICIEIKNIILSFIPYKIKIIDSKNNNNQ